jgi:glutamine amidotransferase of anthranilate synthase or aminodeoxychorismate synthase
MILIIDNYDSFTYNIVQYFGELGAEMEIYRNDKISVDEVKSKSPEKIVISPGPGEPKNAGISESLIRSLGGKVPILGVCLGHQSIGEVFGGRIVRAKNIMHGKTSLIYHDGKDIFEGVKNPFEATRYHSLVVERSTLPEVLSIIAETKDKDEEIMGLKHNEYPIWGVQFHPESILTGEGMKILGNFLKI